MKTGQRGLTVFMPISQDMIFFFPYFLFGGAHIKGAPTSTQDGATGATDVRDGVVVGVDPAVDGHDDDDEWVGVTCCCIWFRYCGITQTRCGEWGGFT